MKLDLKTALKYLILFLIGVGALFLAFHGQDLNTIWREIKSANPYYVAISVFAVWVAYVIRAIRWQMLYHSIHYGTSFWHVYHAVMVGYLANLALPRFGEVVRCTVIQKMDKVPVFASLGTVITERLFDVLVLLLTGVALLICQNDIVSVFMHNVIYQQIADRLHQVNYIVILLFAVLLILVSITFVYFLRHRVSKKFLRIFVSLRQGFGAYHKMKRKGLFLVYTLLIWMLYLISMYFGFLAIPATSSLHVGAAFTALVFSGFAMAAPVQGGIGVFHWMVAQSLVLYSVSFKDGLAYAAVIHSSQVLLVLVLGFLSFFLTLMKRSINPHSG